ncbi:BQ5605_C015g07816 [Microbotryum silenes-dioicae]|uniref:BQ5605_C015g07816 protein n=1 Tax=Microbotryum silenes-dioicae TaxID=796604 RepID=A0A2X0NXA9_9BASI|nr:BQ5605_C015g07816 [Microbotryum silenes-dioicae]
MAVDTERPEPPQASSSRSSSRSSSQPSSRSSSSTVVVHNPTSTSASTSSLYSSSIPAPSSSADPVRSRPSPAAISTTETTARTATRTTDHSARGPRSPVSPPLGLASPPVSAPHSRQSSSGASSVIYHSSNPSGASTPSVAATITDHSVASSSKQISTSTSTSTSTIHPSPLSASACALTFAPVGLQPDPSSTNFPTSSTATPRLASTSQSTGRAALGFIKTRETLMATEDDLESLTVTTPGARARHPFDRRRDDDDETEEGEEGDNDQGRSSERGNEGCYFPSTSRARSSTSGRIAHVPPSPSFSGSGSYASVVSGSARARAGPPLTPTPGGGSKTRATSAVGLPPILTSASRRTTARSVSRARLRAGDRDDDHDDDDDDDDDDRPGLLPTSSTRAERPLSPAPMSREAILLGDREDDEVSVRDRGEELVRKRMKERARVKKEAEKAATRKQEIERAAAMRRTTSSSYYDQSDFEAGQTIGMGLPSTATAHAGPSGDDSARNRSVSRPPAREFTASYASTSAAQGGRTVTGGHGVGRSSSRAPASGEEEWAKGAGRGNIAPSEEGETWSPMFPGRQLSSLRGMSYTSSARGGPVGEEPSSEHTEEEVVEASTEDGDVDGEHALCDTFEADEQTDDDDDINDAEVEYTLKDRQDAINVEHPFGLPIWKPALYKKDRSITRNAEKALHDVPSSTVVRHLAPGNLVWTLFFGTALFIVCTLVAGMLWCVPWEGGKYGRVVWELGGYLFWPFGKYVEGWTDQFDDETSNGSEGSASASAHDHDDTGEVLDEEEEMDRASLRRDLESAGSTYGRSRSQTRSASSRPGGSSQRRASSFGSSHCGDASETHLTVRGVPSSASLRVPGDSTENYRLLAPGGQQSGYGATAATPAGSPRGRGVQRTSSEDTVAAPSWRPHDFSKDSSESAHRALRIRALGRTMWWVAFYLIIAPLLLLVCVLCWGLVFTIPMAKLLWVLLRHLNNEPLALHFRSPPKYNAFAAAAPTEIESRFSNNAAATGLDPHSDQSQPGPPTLANNSGVQYPLIAGQRAPPVSRKSVAAAKRHGRLFGPHSTVLLCTYHAMGLQYYKYTIDGVNILFVNLMSLVFFVILDYFYVSPRVAEHHLGGVLAFIASPACMFVLALLSVIPLSYFIGMAVASISAQSSIGMGAVINASFGSIIEIILYSIALTRAKGELVEGSIVGSILAGVLLMPGASMIGGAMRRKEQKFNARSAGVTSTMLIMAIIGILTPTLFYEIYGSFQLTCSDCDPDHRSGTSESCRTCYYEHINPADDPFYKSTVKILSYYCAVLLVLSYLIGLWFSLRTHASQIWQNAQIKHEPHLPRPASAAPGPHAPNGERASLHKRIVPSQLLPRHRSSTIGRASGSYTPLQDSTPLVTSTNPEGGVPPMELPEGMSTDEFHHAFESVTATGVAIAASSRAAHLPLASASAGPGDAQTQRSASHVRDASAANTNKGAADHDAGAGEGGHDAPNWSRLKSASVLLGCTILYAMIAEILVGVVDVVLEGSGIPEKFLGVTLFALVPNTTEFMNAISFAINGNIALSMEIGSAYALQVCLIQAPAMLAFSAFYSIGKETLLHRSFTLVFPRWDVIAIMFSVFLLTYTYIEARAKSNAPHNSYYRGSILCLSYLVLIGGFAFAPAGRDNNPGLWMTSANFVQELSLRDHALAIFRVLFTR